MACGTFAVRFSLAKAADKIKGTLLEVYLEDDEVTISEYCVPAPAAASELEVALDDSSQWKQ